MAALKKLLLAVAVAAFAAFVGHKFLRLNLLKCNMGRLYKLIMRALREISVKHLDCQYLQSIENGAEDITVLKDGLAFISAGLKFPGLPSFSDEPGKMYVLDLLHPKPTPVELQIKGGLDLSSFNPHGISAYTDEADDSVYLFVVNHPDQKSQVEIFRYVEKDTLVHLKTITHPLLYSVNDIVAVGVESFYATNDRYFHNEALQFLVVVMDLALCDVVFYSPQEVRVAASGMRGPNGINISPDRRYIYVSDLIHHNINVYERQEGEQLVYTKSVAVGSLCDNIEVDHKTGDVWIGCHPNAMKFLNFDPEDPPGSEVLRIQNIHSQQPLVSLEYADDGRVLMASSVAAPYDGKLLIGSVFHKALYCLLK